jgi:hypothetical protein
MERLSNQERRERRRVSIRKFLLQYKKSHPCPCGETDPDELTFHHRYPATKLFNIGEWNTVSTISLSKLQNEVKKCDVMCYTCHRETHRKMREERYAVLR